MMKEEKDEILSDYATALILTINSSICMVISALGSAANIINIVIFIKHGFTDTVNISLVALAISDIGCLTTVQWINIAWNPLFVNSGVPWIISDVIYLTGGCLHASFGRITSWITSFITLEKCLCVFVPFKVKSIITATLTKTVMITIYIIMLLLHLPDYITLYLGWKYSPEFNKTLIGLVPRENSIEIDFLSFVLMILFQIISFIAVIIFTSILVIKIRLNLKWRKSVTSINAESSRNHQRRNDKTIRMIIVVALVYILCFLPTIIVIMSSVVVHELSISGQFRNAFLAICSVAFVAEAINSSANIFIYYSASSKYKSTFDQLFGSDVKQK